MKLNRANHRKDATRSRIVTAAKHLFLQFGYAETSMAQISGLVGGSKATLYSHFKSKDELLIAVVEDVVRPVNKEVAAGPPTADFRAWLHWLGQMGLRRLLSEEIVAVRRIATAESRRFPEFGRVLFDKGVIPSFEPVTAVFADAMARGTLRKDDPHELAMLFLELCSGWLLRRVEWNIAPEPGDAEIAQAVARAVRIFMDGCALPAAKP
jgi:TetR/AcrR family transcriptional repressor of mexJK operon